jgi:hypothetical protein
LFVRGSGTDMGMGLRGVCSGSYRKTHASNLETSG